MFGYNRFQQDFLDKYLQQKFASNSNSFREGYLVNESLRSYFRRKLASKYFKVPLEPAYYLWEADDRHGEMRSPEAWAAVKQRQINRVKKDFGWTEERIKDIFLDIPPDKVKELSKKIPADKLKEIAYLHGIPINPSLNKNTVHELRENVPITFNVLQDEHHKPLPDWVKQWSQEKGFTVPKEITNAVDYAQNHRTHGHKTESEAFIDYTTKNVPEEYRTTTLAKEENLIKRTGSKLKNSVTKLKNRLTKFVNLMKARPGATAAGALGLTGLGIAARKGLIPGFSKPSLGKKVLKTIGRNKGLAALGLLGAAGGAYALSNRNKNKKRAFDIEDLLEKYYNL
jgi:hypothetical protein